MIHIDGGIYEVHFGYNTDIRNISIVEFGYNKLGESGKRSFKRRKR